MFTLTVLVLIFCAITKVQNQTYNSTTRSSLSPSNLPFCCAQTYNSKRFLISSPGFPSNNNNENDCVYNIYRANSNVCRLRLHFNFFWLQDYQLNYGCFNEFLEIDGKHICGCQTELKLISPFDSRWEKLPKTIRFKRQLAQNRLSGFVLEVIQDECPKRITPKEYDPVNDSKVRIQRDVENNSKIFKHVYVFGSPSDNDLSFVPKKTQEIEQTSYKDTFTINSALAGSTNYEKCQNWGNLQWETLAKEFQQNSLCNDINSRTIIRQYVLANHILGYIQSPRFPYSYPGNLNLGYRIVKQPNYCAVRITFEEFSLENSVNCNRDRLTLMGKYRYCGRSLYRATLTFDLRNKRYEDILFNTYGNSCRRGFRAIYEQIPCYNIPPPNRPTYPIIQPPTQCPPHVTTPKDISCGRNILDNNFVIEAYEYHQPKCVFNIFKNNAGVCGLALSIVISNLICGIERLIINNQPICGQLADRTFYVNFNRNQLSLIYERSTKNPGITGLRFRLTGVQMTDGCEPYEYPQVPAERFLTPNNGSLSFIENNSDFCGVISNNTNNTNVNLICNQLNQGASTKKCIEIRPNVLFVPKEPTALGLYMNLVNSLSGMSTTGTNVLYEILCQDIKKLGINL